MAKHRCPVNLPEPCEAQVPDTMLMCARHWRQVPRDLQRAVYRAWRARQAELDVGPAFRGHLQACEDAIAAVEDRESRELFPPDDDDAMVPA